MTHGPPSSSASSQRMALDVPRFVGLFLDRFAAGDVDGIAELWDVPALVLGDEHVHGAMSRDQVSKWFADAVRETEELSRARYLSASEHIEELDWLSARVVAVKLAWPRGAVAGFSSGVDATTFRLRVDPFDKLRIRALLLRGHGDFGR